MSTDRNESRTAARRWWWLLAALIAVWFALLWHPWVPWAGVGR